MSSQTQPPLFREAIASSPPPQYDFNDRIPEVILLVRYLARSSLTRSTSKSLRILIKQGTSLWYLRDQCWRGLQQMFHCTRCSWMSAPSGCSNRQRIQRERVKQWVFWDLFLCSVVDGTLITKRPTELLRPGRVNAVSVFVVFPKSTSWISVNRRYFLLWQPALRELFLYCHDSAIYEEFIPWIESWSNHYWHCSLCWPGCTNFTSQVHHERMWVDFMPQMLILSSWPAMFVCPACSLLCGFRANRFKVRGCLLCQEVAAHLFNRENSAFYLHSIPTISHTISHSMYWNHRAVSILASHQSAIADQTPRFNNSEFIDNSSQSFLNLVITMDPNFKWDLSNTLPQWPQ